MLSSFLFGALFFVDQASAHGRLTVPTTRLGDPARYENDPVIYSSKQFVCRNDKNNAVTPPVYTAGDVIQIQYLLSAPHVGDAAVYISYDGDLPFATRENMRFFKIANIPRARDTNSVPYSITLPSWLPSGNAVLRWEWYALHVNPKIELYAQCSDIVIQGSANEIARDQVPMYFVVDQNNYDPATLPKQNVGDIWGSEVTLYRNAFDTNNYVQFMTGPACARGFTGNNCGETAPGTTGYVDMGTGPSPTTTTTAAPATTTTAAPAPTTTTAAPATTTAAPATTTTAAPAPTTAAPAPTTTQAPATTTAAPAPTTAAPAPGQCTGTYWPGSTCTTETAECCPAGTQCYAMNQWWSGCFAACQEGWLCSQPVDTVCPTRTSGAQCDGVNFTDNVGCCTTGYNCYRYNEWWSGCFQGPCPAGYEC